MESTIVVALITAIGTIINTVISKKTNKKIDTVDELKKMINSMREENKIDMQNHILDARTFNMKAVIQMIFIIYL